MALILSIETSTKVCSVALHRNGDLVALKEGFEANSHSETLLQFIQEVFEEAEIAKSELKAIAVSKGPGSYTGLRIGVSTAKGLAYGLDIPLISVDTLESLSLGGLENQNSEDGFYVPMIDARRMEVYCAVFDQQMNQILPTEAKIIEEDSFVEYLEKGKVYFFGDGAMKLKGTILHSNAVFVEGLYTSAKQMGKLAFARFQDKKFEDVAYYEPYYLKEFMTKPSKKKLL